MPARRNNYIAVLGYKNPEDSDIWLCTATERKNCLLAENTQPLSTGLFYTKGKYHPVRAATSKEIRNAKKDNLLFVTIDWE